MRSFLPSRAALVRTGVAVVLLATSAGPARAQTATAAPLSSVHDAWDAGDFDRVPALCEKALQSGGLARADVVDAYTRLGAALAIAGKTKPAVAAFRKAALVDPAFKVPPEAGKKAIALAEAARRAQRKAGSLAVSLQVTEPVTPGSSFAVEVTLSPARETAVTAITLDATDTLTAHTFEQRASGTSHSHFEVPARLTLPDASLLVRVHARDVHDNELAEADRRVHVTPAPPPVETGPLAALSPSPPPRAHGETRTTSSSGGGFWSSAWPYVIGGAALAAGGAATWFLTRPTDNVDVGAVRVQLMH